MHERVSAIVAESLEVQRRYFAERAEEVVRAASMIAAAFSTGGKVLACGDGASAAGARELAGELLNQSGRAGRRALPALALSADAGLLASEAGGAGFEEIFARQVEAFGERGDVLVALSAAGRAAGVVRACAAAGAKELKVIGLLGGDGGEVAALCDLALVVPSDDERRTREAHALVAHVLCELVERTLFPGER